MGILLADPGDTNSQPLSQTSHDNTMFLPIKLNLILYSKIEHEVAIKMCFLLYYYIMIQVIRVYHIGSGDLLPPTPQKTHPCRGDLCFLLL